MDSIGYYGFLAKNLAPKRLVRAAGLRLWRQTTLPILPLPTRIGAAELLRALGVESAAGLPALLGEDLEGPLALRSAASARESAAWIREHLPAEAAAAAALAARSLARRIVVFGREVELPLGGAAVPLTSPGWIGIDWEVDPIVKGEQPALFRGEAGGGGGLRGSSPEGIPMAARRGAGEAGGSRGLRGSSSERIPLAARRGGAERIFAPSMRPMESTGDLRSTPAIGVPSDGARIPAGKDPKRQWIVGRLEEVVHLACGALLALPDDPARAEACVDAALDRMVDFAQAPRGIQWTCTMEVALRAANMAIALRLLAGQRRLDERADGLQEILRSLALHLAWIPRHLEDTGVVANNHLVANWVGMLAVAALFPRLPGAHLAARRASKGVADELMAQTLPDGFGFEGSVPYHRLAIELFLLGDLFATTAGLPLPEPVRRRLALAFLATSELVDGRGLAPRIGDDDSGRAIPFGQRDPLELGWLAGIGAALFDRPALEDDPPSPEQVWLLGPPKEGSPSRRAGRARHLDSALHHGGIYLLRSQRLGASERIAPAEVRAPLPPALRAKGSLASAQPPASREFVKNSRTLSVAIACGPNGTGGLGTHGHNDKLSVEICVDGILVVGDPGSGSYSGDPALRNHLRGTAAHSTVQLDGAEQQPLPLGRLFALPDQAHPRCISFESSPDRARFVGEHRGYQRLGATHRRTVTLDRAAQAIEIVDRIGASAGIAPTTREQLLPATRSRGGAPSSLPRLRLTGRVGHRAQCRFLIPGEAGRPRVRGEGEEGWVVEIGVPGRAIALLIPEPGTPRPILEPAWYARGYDQVEAATAVVFEKAGPLPLVFRTTIRPARGDVPG